MKIRYLVYLIFYCIVSTANGQSHIIDSLEQNLANEPDNNKKAVLSLDIAWEFLSVNIDSTFIMCDKAIYYAKKAGNQLEVANALNIMGIGYLYKGKFDSTLFFVEKAINKIKELKKQEHADSTLLNVRLFKFKNTLANAWYYLSEFQNAINNYLFVLKLAEELNDKHALAMIYMNIGAVYKEWGDYKQSVKYLKKGLEFSMANKLTTSAHNIMINLGATYFNMGNTDSSHYYYKMLLPEMHLLNDESRFAVYVNLSQIFIKTGKTDSAKLFLEKARPLAQLSTSEYYLLFYHYTYGEYLLKTNEHTKSINELNIAYNIADRIGDEKIKISIVGALHDNYSEIKNYKKAYELSIYEKQLSDTVFNEERNRTISEMQVRFDVEKNKILIRNLQQEKEKVKRIQLLSIIIFIIVIIVLLLIIRNIVLKRKKQKLERQKLKGELYLKTKQLTTHTLNIMQKNKNLQEIQLSVHDISTKKDKSDISTDLDRLNLKVKRCIRADKDWEVFKLYFEQVNHNFFEKLKAIGPDLNQRELQLAALIKLNMNIKEAAAVLNLSPISVKSSRSRLRKKLKLSQKEKLSTFIGSI